MSDDLIKVTYRLETPGDPTALAAKIASDQSTGTFTDLPGETAAVKARCAARVLSITALPVMGRILMECNMAHRPLGVMAISAAAINDVVGWLLLALVTALSVAQFQATGFALNVLAVLVFIVASWWLIRPPLKRVVRWTQARPDRDGVTSPLPNDLLGILIAAIFIGGMTTYKLGIFAIFGGFMLGVLLHDENQTIKAVNARALTTHLLELTIQEGKYHQVKRMIAAAGNRCEALHRLSVGEFSLPTDLAIGDWRFLEL